MAALAVSYLSMVCSGTHGGSTDYSSIHLCVLKSHLENVPSPQVEDCLGECVHEASLVYLGDGICVITVTAPAANLQLCRVSLGLC